MKYCSNRKSISVVKLAMVCVMSAGWGYAQQTHHGQTTPPNPKGGKYPFSLSTLADGTLYVSGTIGMDAETGKVPANFEDEVRACLFNLRDILKASDMDYEDVVSVQIFMTDMTMWGRMNAVYTEILREPLPSRVAVGVTGLAIPAARIEIAAIARKRVPHVAEAVHDKAAGGF